MAKIKSDLVGVTYAGGHVLKAGDTIPQGVQVGGHLTADGKDYGFPKVKAEPVVEKGVEPLNDAEKERAAELGIPDDVHPERVRGAIEGYEQGQADAAAEADRVAAEAAEAERLAAEAAAAPGA